MNDLFTLFFSSMSFTVSGLFKSLIHFRFIFVSDVCKTGVLFHSSACGYPVLPTPFIEETNLSPLNILGSLVKY